MNGSSESYLILVFLMRAVRNQSLGFVSSVAIEVRGSPSPWNGANYVEDLSDQRLTLFLCSSKPQKIEDLVIRIGDDCDDHPNRPNTVLTAIVEAPSSSDSSTGGWASSCYCTRLSPPSSPVLLCSMGTSNTNQQQRGVVDHTHSKQTKAQQYTTSSFLSVSRSLLLRRPTHLDIKNS